MNKKYISIIALVVGIILVVLIVALFVLPGMFTPPVDVSGVSPSATLSTNQLLPSTLAGKQLNTDSVTTETEMVTIGSRMFEVEHTSALFDGVTVHIIKAQSVSHALDTLKVLLEDDAWYGGSSAYTKTNDWFTASKGGGSAFFWRSDAWVFGVDAGDEATRNNVAGDLVQHLKTL